MTIFFFFPLGVVFCTTNFFFTISQTIVEGNLSSHHSIKFYRRCQVEQTERREQVYVQPQPVGKRSLVMENRTAYHE